ncbi:MAG: hypothetical protein FWE02_04825 [Defluviitaleaceae bacterium]|nr:hypothetical protein [Defluviitaleaceae bacterium]
MGDELITFYNQSSNLIFKFQQPINVTIQGVNDEIASTSERPSIETRDSIKILEERLQLWEHALGILEKIQHLDESYFDNSDFDRIIEKWGITEKNEKDKFRVFVKKSLGDLGGFEIPEDLDIIVIDPSWLYQNIKNNNYNSNIHDEHDIIRKILDYNRELLPITHDAEESLKNVEQDRETSKDNIDITSERVHFNNKLKKIFARIIKFITWLGALIITVVATARVEIIIDVIKNIIEFMIDIMKDIIEFLVTKH